MKKTGSCTPINPVRIRTNEKEVDIEGDSDIDSNTIDDRIINLSNIIKMKKNSGIEFFTFKTSLAFTQ